MRVIWPSERREMAGPELETLDQTISNLEADQRSLIRVEAERDAWLAQHPEADAPQSSFDLGDLLDRLRPAAGWAISPEPNSAGLDRGAAVERPTSGSTWALDHVPLQD